MYKYLVYTCIYYSKAVRVLYYVERKKNLCHLSLNSKVTR